MAKEQYSMSRDEERYYGKFDTIEEALAEAESNDYGTVWIGIVSPPPAPESRWCAEDWLEDVSCQDEYCGEWAEAWDRSTEKQRQELEDEVRQVMAAWLDRHKLRPTFWNINGATKYVADENGKLAVAVQR